MVSMPKLVISIRYLRFHEVHLRSKVSGLLQRVLALHFVAVNCVHDACSRRLRVHRNLTVEVALYTVLLGLSAPS